MTIDDDELADLNEDAVAAGAEPWVTLAAAAKHFSIAKRTLYQMMTDGLLTWLPSGTRGRRVRIGDVERAMRARSEPKTEGKR